MNQSESGGGCDPRHTKKDQFNHRLSVCQRCEVCIGDRKYLYTKARLIIINLAFATVKAGKGGKN